MARYKLPAAVVLLHVCRLSAEVNGPTDLLHRPNNVDEQRLAGNNGSGRTHRAAATSTTATRTYRGNNFVDPSDYEDVEVVSLTPVGVHNAPNAAAGGIGNTNRMRGRNLKRTKAETRAVPVNGKSAKGTPRARRRGFRTNIEQDAFDEIVNRAQRELEDPVPIDIGSDSIVTTNSTVTTASDPNPDNDPDRVFDPRFNGGDAIAIEKEMRDGGVAFEYDESSTSTANNNDFEVDFGSYSISFSGSFSTDFGRSCKSSKGSGKVSLINALYCVLAVKN